MKLEVSSSTLIFYSSLYKQYPNPINILSMSPIRQLIHPPLPKAQPSVSRILLTLAAANHANRIHFSHSLTHRKKQRLSSEQQKHIPWLRKVRPLTLSFDAAQELSWLCLSILVNSIIRNALTILFLSLRPRFHNKSTPRPRHQNLDEIRHRGPQEELRRYSHILRSTYPLWPLLSATCTSIFLKSRTMHTLHMHVYF